MNQEQNQRRLEHLLVSKDIDFEKIDGALVENKEIRGTLFTISNERGAYPQCFFRLHDGSYEFVGLWTTMEVMKIFDIINLTFTLFNFENIFQSLAECDSIPDDVLASNPSIPTFAKVNIRQIYHNDNLLGTLFRCLLMQNESQHLRNRMGICANFNSTNNIQAFIVEVDALF